MSNPHAKMRFKRIETRAVLPDGRTISSSRSYPNGVGYDAYRRIDQANVRAFGSRTSKTIGTPVDDI